jgi:adenine-specific DNA glycosylase
MIMVTAAIRCDGRLLFVQRPQAGLWAGLWELPSETGDPQETPTTARSRLRSLLPQGCRLAREPRAMITRQLTHRRITFHLFTGTARQPELPARTIHGSARWLSRNELDQIGLSNASRALLAEIEER